MPGREFDIVLYGATGFAGRQAVAYLKSSAPAGLCWAIAGRDRVKLDALGAGVPVLVADAQRPEELAAVAARTTVMASTAGPFRRYSDPLVTACIAARTDYVDISGETARIRDLIDRCHDAAAAARMRVVNFCAVSSIPADLGVHLLDAHFGGRLQEARGYLEVGGGSFNGGTIASMSDAIESGDAVREADPFLLNPMNQRSPLPLERDPRGVRRQDEVRLWGIRSPLGISDTRAVRRSGALTGRDFIYQEYLVFPKGVLSAVGMNVMLGTFGAAMAFRPIRNAIRKRLPPGAGPSEAVMDAGWMRLRIVGQSDEEKRAVVTISDQGDLGNRITVKCLCESALTLAVNREQVPAIFGVLTPSVAFGEVVVERLRAVGMRFDLQSS